MLFSSFATLLIASSALAAPVPKWKREVPQEHSHEAIIRAVRPVLNLNNPDAIVDVIFGLLGNAAASTGKGNIADPDCLQTATADQAFTNAKAAGDVAGMTAALQYRALERNTGAVGQASVLCTSFTPVNPEIAALTQHQDPASNNAAAINKGIVLELAKQIAAIGGNPLDALATGTFAPGQIGDPTGAGNTCDDENDAIGCIVSLNRLVLDATEEEILAAVGGNDNATPPAADDSAAADCPSVVTVTVTADTAAATSTEAAAPATTTAASTGNNNTGNLQSFTGALGGIEAPKVTPGGRNFVVENNADFLNIGAALGRSCDVQHNQCANAANAGANFSVGDCDRQNDECRQAINGANVAAITTRQEATTTAVNQQQQQQQGGNLQAFSGALGGIQAPAVTPGGRNFVVANNSDFLNIGAALGRSCDVQHNQCANAANSGADFTVGDCDRQNEDCRRNI